MFRVARRMAVRVHATRGHTTTALPRRRTITTREETFCAPAAFPKAKTPDWIRSGVLISITQICTARWPCFAGSRVLCAALAFACPTMIGAVETRAFEDDRRRAKHPACDGMPIGASRNRSDHRSFAPDRSGRRTLYTGRNIAARVPSHSGLVLRCNFDRLDAGVFDFRHFERQDAILESGFDVVGFTSAGRPIWRQKLPLRRSWRT